VRIVEPVYPVRPELAAAPVIQHALAPVPAAVRARFPALTGFLVRTEAHRVPSADAGNGSMRVSTRLDNTLDEIDRFVACVSGIATHGR
jgi:cysteine desulfurase / selenocysteine lyase